MVRAAERALTELLAWAVQETAVVVRVTLSQAGGVLTVQVVKSAGRG
jgi:outer membrane biosynthesis protein TonB